MTGEALLRREGVRDFEALVAKYRHLVWRVAYRTLRDPEDALDVTQEVLVRLHRNLPRLAVDTRLGAWLTRVTTNAALNSVREQKTRLRHQRRAGSEMPRSVESPPAGGLREAIAMALDALPRQQKAVVTLRLLDQRTFRDIADCFGVSEGTVKVQFSRGMRKMRQRLAEWR